MKKLSSFIKTKLFSIRYENIYNEQEIVCSFVLDNILTKKRKCVVSEEIHYGTVISNDGNSLVSIIQRSVYKNTDGHPFPIRLLNVAERKHYRDGFIQYTTKTRNHHLHGECKGYYLGNLVYTDVFHQGNHVRRLVTTDNIVYDELDYYINKNRIRNHYFNTEEYEFLAYTNYENKNLKIFVDGKEHSEPLAKIIKDSYYRIMDSPIGIIYMLCLTAVLARDLHILLRHT